MGYSNVQGSLNVLSSTSTQDLVVRGDATHLGNIVSTQGYATFGNVSVSNLFVTGNFTVTATNTQATNALSINNSGTSTALKVIQFEGGGPGHTYNVAEFWDFQTLAMVIDPEGNVAIHATASPGYALTVVQGASIDTLKLGTPLPVASGGIGSATTTNNWVFAGPSVGSAGPPSFRSLVNVDLPQSIAVSNVAANGAALSSLNSSNLVGNVANANVALVVSQPFQPNITQVGTLTGLYSTGNITATFFAGGGNALSNIQSAALVGNVANANVALVVSGPLQPNITQVGTLTGLYSTGNITATFFTGGGNALSNIQSAALVGNVANANVALVVSQPSQPNITQVGTLTGLYSTGNLTATFFAGGGNALSNIQSAALVGNVANANVALVVSQPLQPNITGLGTLTGLYSTGNITATFFTGQGNGLSNIQSSVLVGNVASANVALVVSQPLQPNITQVGTLTGLYSTGNLTATFFAGGGNALSNIQSSALVGNVANANVALVVSQPSQPNITSVGILTSLNIGGVANVTSTLYTQNIVSSGFTSNATNTNFNFSTLTLPFIYSTTLNTASVTNLNSIVTTSLNVSGLLTCTNGSGISNILGSSVTGNVANANVALVVSQPSQPNITQVGTLTGLYSTGNLTATFFSGGGNALSNIQSAALVGNVANANVALVVSQPSQPNITGLGTLTGLYSTGNLTATFFTGGGNALSNIQSSVLVGNVANANVALVVSQPLQPNITQVGTLTGLYSTGNLTATFFSGGGNALSNIQSAALVGNVANANVALVVSQPSQPNITSVGTLTSLVVSGVLNASLHVGNASALSNINSSNLVGNVANANVALVVSQPLQPNITGLGTLTGLYSTGNLTATFFTGQGNGLSNIQSSVLVGNVANANVALVVSQPSQPNITQVGTLTGLYSTGNIAAAFFSGGGNALSNIQSSVLVGNVANANVALVVSGPLQPNITQVGTLTGLYSTGNIAATFFSGGGNALSNIQSAALVGNVANANVALVVSQPLQPNITQVGTLTGLYSTGNLTATFFSGGGNALSNIQSAALVGNVANANVALVVSQPAQPNITGLGTLTSLNVTGISNLTDISANGFSSNAATTVFNCDTLTIPFFYSTTLNVTTVANTGTLVALNLYGQGNGLSNIQSSVLVGNVANSNVALVVSQPLQPNITQVGTLTGLYSTGNITATFFSGGGNALSNIQSAALVGNVANANVALVVSQPSQPNITSVGTTGSLFTVQGLLVAGNASGLSNINSSNLVGNVANANVALVVSQPLQPNITGLGTLTGLTTGNVVVTGLTSGGFLRVQGASNALSVATIPLGSGGTNQTTYGTVNGVLYYDGTQFQTATSITVGTGSTLNVATLNVASISTPAPVPASSGLFMNLNATYTLNPAGSWTGNVAGSITSNLFTLFGPSPTASWTAYGSNPLITGPTVNGGFRFSRTGPYQFTVVIASDNNIKTIALSSNTSDIHSNLADPGVWLYCYRISVGQDPSVPVQIPFYVDSTSKYYYIDFESMKITGENIHRTAYTNVTTEGYTGSYVTLRPM